MSLSEIRVNTTKTRTGVGTITYTETGPVITGIATASNFKTGSTNVHSTGVELANINTGGSTATFGGPISGTTASFSGNVSVGGTLTYEDVTNIDAVGVITARGGIDSNGGIDVDGDISITGSTLQISYTTCLIDLMETGATNHRIRNGNGNFHIQKISNDKNTVTNQIVIDGGTGETALYHSGTKKLATTSTGAVVTGILTATGQVNFESDGSYIKSNQLRFNSSGHAYIDHGTNAKDISFRLSNSGTLNQTMLQMDADGEITKFHKVISVGLQGGDDTAVLAGGAGVGAYLVLKHATTGINTKLMGNNDSWLNANHGNLGIGTNNPTAALDVRNASGTDPTFFVGHSNADVIGEAIRIGRVAPYSTIRYHSIKAEHSGGTTSNMLAFHLHNGSTATSQTEVMRLRGDGYVGIGTIAPDSKLSVYSGTAGSVSADGDANELTLESSGNTGMSILSPGSGESSIYFGNPGTNGNKEAWLKYYHETHTNNAKQRSLQIKVAGGECAYFNSTGLVMSNDKGLSFINADDTATGETVSSSVLDDYEEGSCVMNYSPASGSFSGHIYTSGKYVKIGRLVMVTGSISLNGAGTASGRMDIIGWPYAPQGINSTWSLESGHGTIKGHYNYPDEFNMVVMNNGGTNAYVYKDDGNYLQVGSSGMGTGYNECQCSFTVTYYAEA